MINLAKCEHWAGNWACLQCLWFPLLVELTYRLPGSFSPKSSPMTALTYTLVSVSLEVPPPPHPGWAVSAAAAPWPWCPPRSPHHYSSLASLFHSWGKGCPATSAHLCKLSLTGTGATRSLWKCCSESFLLALPAGLSGSAHPATREPGAHHLYSFPHMHTFL